MRSAFAAVNSIAVLRRWTARDDRTICGNRLKLSEHQQTVMKTVSFRLRVHSHQLSLIDRAAKLLGRSRLDFLLEAACQRAQAVLIDQTHFSVNADQFQRFVDLLDAPPQPDAGLERLLAQKPHWKEA
jgi:uncharacterized protein (DUF1778 family)